MAEKIPPALLSPLPATVAPLALGSSRAGALGGEWADARRAGATQPGERDWPVRLEPPAWSRFLEPLRPHSRVRGCEMGRGSTPRRAAVSRLADRRTADWSASITQV